jgi:murein DD-endopeptidase MepM/ murein hydrolase activator NlpD
VADFWKKAFSVLNLFSLMVLVNAQVYADIKVASGSLYPGGYTVLQVSPTTHQVRFHGKTLSADNEGRVIIGFGRDAKSKQVVEELDGAEVVGKTVLNLTLRRYTVQKINGLPKNKVTPDKKTQDKIWQDILLAKKARKINLPQAYFESGFIWPTSGVISGIYGSQRILNGHPRRPHLGVDIAAPEGQVLVAPADGKVTLNKNMVLSGNTVMIDHGHGLRSTVMHLHKVYVKKDEVVKKGQPIGEVGQTGRATGPHVHWGMSWFNTRLDPSLSILPKPTLKPGDKVVSPALQKEAIEAHP